MEKDEAINNDAELEVKKSAREQMVQDLVRRTRGVEEDVEAETLDESLNENLDENLEEDLEEEEMVTLKVNGEEIKVSRDKVHDAGIRTLQKETSADKRLREVSEKEAELEKRRAELDDLERQLLSKAKDEPDDFGRQFQDSLFTDDDTAAKIMTNLKRKIDELEGTVKEVETKEKRKEETALQTAIKYYHSTYSDIASDEEKHSLFNQRLNRIAKESPELSMNEAIDRAANGYYEKFGKPETEEPSKKSVKENLTKQPKGASVRQTPPPEKKTKTRADTLKDMRQSRGARPY